MKISEVLFKADKVLDECGWMRGNFSDRSGYGGPVCAAGAIRVAICGNPWTHSSIVEQVMTEFEKVLPAGQWTSNWNDRVVKDKRTVQRKFRKAARLLAKAGQ